MFGLGPATRIYVALGATDLRKGFDGLHGIVRDRLGLEVRSVAADQSDRVSLSHEELSLLLGGIDLTRTRRKNWYRKTVLESEKV